VSEVVQPAGTVTLVFTDIEGSTRLLSELGEDVYRDALREHRRVVREAFGRRGGYEIDYDGDAFFYAFASAGDALSAVEEAMSALGAGPIRIRVGVHTGEPALDPPKYVGLDVHRAARVMAAGHGGQVLVSRQTRELAGEGFEFRDLGEHRLKDLTGPQRLYQLGAGEFKPLRTLYRTNLPVPGTPFLGREAELAEVCALVRGGGYVTLTGPGGTGKTRLAAQAAAEVADDFPDGVWWVPLSAVSDPALVLGAVAQAMDVQEEAGVPLDVTLRAALGGKRVLLLLDNAEHLLPDAAEHVASLGGSEGPAFLVTSRERLHLSAERVFPVPSLAERDGIELFTQRARALGLEIDDTPAVSALCASLDNLPLAIELAAARTAILSPAEILARLSTRLDSLKGPRDVDPRHQTLRATIEWSYELLSEEERTLFARLAVFAGGSTLEAAEEVTEADLDTLASLLDKSLLRRSGDRYWMLATIREYALERLEQLPGHDELRRRYAAHYLALASAGEAELWGRDQKRWLDLLETEHPNMRDALAWSIRTGDGETAMKLIAALQPFWEARGHVDEGRRWFAEATERGGAVSGATRSKALFAISRLAGMQSDYAEERDLLEQAVALARDPFAPHELIFALSHLGSVVAQAFGDRDRAEELHEECLALARSHGDPWLTAMALNNSGFRLVTQGDLEGARPLLEESLALRRALGEKRGIAVTLGSLAELAIAEGDYEGAMPALTESLELAREIDHREVVAIALAERGVVALLLGEPEEAGRDLEEALALCRELGSREVGAICAAGFAASAVAAGDVRRGVRLWGAADALVEETGTAAQSQTRPLFERFLPDARAALAPAEFELEWGTGRRLGFQDALALAFPDTPLTWPAPGSQTSGRSTT